MSDDKAQYTTEQDESQRVDLAHNVNAKYVYHFPLLFNTFPGPQAPSKAASCFLFQLSTSHNANIIFSHIRIQNPLYGKSRQRLLSDVEEFTKKWGFDDDLEIFQKAALVAQHPVRVLIVCGCLLLSSTSHRSFWLTQNEFETLDLLDDDDRYHLRRETTREPIFVRLPLVVWLIDLPSGKP